MQPDRWRDGPTFPAYYWAGSGSARIHRLKGFTFGVDTEAYAKAYDENRIQWLQREAGIDFLFLSYNWGLPPEVERHDWAAFEQAAAVAHANGLGVAAYVQPSNAVAAGSFAYKDWYAVTPKGKRIPYYNGRFFTCLNNVEWRETVHTRVADAARRGADAIFLDNCAFGGMPIPLSRDYTAFAGCFCSSCQVSFADWQRAKGFQPARIPRRFSPGRDPVAKEYAHWRAWVLTSFLREIRDRLKAGYPGIRLLTNTVGAVNVNTYFVFGVDLPELAHVVDWMFVENLQAPRASKKLLVQNAGTFKLLSSLKPGAPALSISYEKGIGVDGIPSSSTFRRTAAEAIAVGGVPVLRATEYIRENRWTVLQPGLGEPECNAARDVVRFAALQEHLFTGRVNAAVVGVYVPPGLAWRGDIFPDSKSDYLAVIQALVGCTIPFRLVSSLRDSAGLRALIVPDGVPVQDFDGKVLSYSSLGISKRRRSLFDLLGGPLEPLLRRLGPALIDAYYQRVHVRRFADRVNLLFRVVFHDQFVPVAVSPGVLATLRGVQPVVAIADGPVLAELWRTPNGVQLHLVNYLDSPLPVTVVGPRGHVAAVHSPAGELQTKGSSLLLDGYAVVEWSDETRDEVRTPGKGGASLAALQ